MAREKVWDSWEDMEDSGELDKRLEQEKKLEDKVVPPVSIPVVTEDTHRTAYQPQLRILKRESASGDQASANNVGAKGCWEDKNTQEIRVGLPALFRDKFQNKAKTLAEREAAYAEARLRILGSAKSEEPEEARPPEESPPPVLMKKSPSKSADAKNAPR